MTLIFNHIYYVTYFFLLILYQLFLFVYIMSIITIKTYYSTIKPLILFQYIICIISFDLYYINIFMIINYIIHTSFIEISIEAGILLCGNGASRHGGLFGKMGRGGGAHSRSSLSVALLRLDRRGQT